LISLGIMAGLMVWYRFAPDWRVLLCPVFMLLAFGPAIGIGLWLSALNVKYRDVKHVVPFIVQFGLYVSPVGFSSSVVPEKWRLLYSLNPMVGVIDGFRWSFLHGESPLSLSAFLSSVCVTFLLLASGLWYFRKVERTFADVI